VSLLLAVVAAALLGLVQKVFACFACFWLFSERAIAFSARLGLSARLQNWVVCVSVCVCCLVFVSTAGTAPKTVTYTLASLLMLCMGDTRNAAVVARAGAIPALVSIAREGSSRAANRELASALLAVMCRSQAAQVDVVASGGIPALTRCVFLCGISTAVGGRAPRQLMPCLQTVLTHTPTPA
jgi:hypothetical protein